MPANRSHGLRSAAPAARQSSDLRAGHIQGGQSVATFLRLDPLPVRQTESRPALSLSLCGHLSRVTLRVIQSGELLEHPRACDAGRHFHAKINALARLPWKLANPDAINPMHGVHAGLIVFTRPCESVTWRMMDCFVLRQESAGSLGGELSFSCAGVLMCAHSCKMSFD